MGFRSGGLCPGGLCAGRSLSGEGICPGGLCLGKVSVRGVSVWTLCLKIFFLIDSNAKMWDRNY